MSGKTVLLLGSGMCSHPIISYLDEHGYTVIVASRTPNASKTDGTNRAKPIKLDLETTEGEKTMDEITPTVDAVISLLPYLFHPKAAGYALKHKKHFLCASYVSDGLRALAPAFKEAGLQLACELGVDPGTDHMTAMEIFDRVHEQGGKILYFTSFAGGLPAPECNDNPFGYKFSWAPKGVLLAGKNSASFYRDGDEQFIKGEDLFRSFWHFEVAPFSTFEVYPNRDSKPYREIYGIPECRTLIRGTLRNAGWCEKIKMLVNLGYVDETKVNLKGKTYGQLTRELAKVGDNGAALSAGVATFLGVPHDSHVIKAFEWLGLFDPALPIPEGQDTHLDALCHLMRAKMTLQPDQRDLMVLRHTVVAAFEDRVEKITSTLVDYGTVHADTSMARTTSLPLAIAVRELLEGRFTLTGLHIPTTKAQYVPILAELKKLGIAYVDEVKSCPRVHLWVRAECKPGERRAPITPQGAARLISGGFRITVERSSMRCFEDEAYAKVGCTLVSDGDWRTAPKEALILGLKELPADGSALSHRHIFFCHAFKNQAGWKEELARFTRGGGSLYDLEYLTWPDGRRVAAFGRAAGLAGAALGVFACALGKNNPLPKPLVPWKSETTMIEELKKLVAGRRLTAMVMGALGRSGRGACDVLEACGVKVTKWDLAEVKDNPGPYPLILEHDIFVNCVLLSGPVKPFLTQDMISQAGTKLSVIVDVSCDTSNPHNPLPMCNRNTTLVDPVLWATPNVTCITIDHLPTLLPAEASHGFSTDLVPHLETLPEGDIWTRALALFKQKSSE